MVLCCDNGVVGVALGMLLNMCSGFNLIGPLLAVHMHQGIVVDYLQRCCV